LNEFKIARMFVRTNAIFLYCLRECLLVNKFAVYLVLFDKKKLKSLISYGFYSSWMQKNK